MDAAQFGEPDGLLPAADQPRRRTRQPGRNLTETPAPIIVTALLGDADFAWADGLRRAHFPPERNLVPAHLTLFHALPPDVAPELKRRIGEETRGRSAPPARIARILDLGGGTGFLIDSPELVAIRDRLAEGFHGLLTRQDAHGFRPHITIQNKVDRAAAKALQAELAAIFRARPIALAGLAAWAYRGGPWQPLFRQRFG